jgi:hypothetical protein
MMASQAPGTARRLPLSDLGITTLDVSDDAREIAAMIRPCPSLENKAHPENDWLVVDEAPQKGERLTRREPLKTQKTRHFVEILAQRLTFRGTTARVCYFSFVSATEFANCPTHSPDEPKISSSSFRKK